MNVFTEFYRNIVFSDTEIGDVNYKEIAKVLFNEVDRLNSIIEQIKLCVYYYANTDEDESKIFNDEEKEILTWVEKVGSDKY